MHFLGPDPIDQNVPPDPLDGQSVKQEAGEIHLVEFQFHDAGFHLSGRVLTTIGLLAGRSGCGLRCRFGGYFGITRPREGKAQAALAAKKEGQGEGLVLLRTGEAEAVAADGAEGASSALCAQGDRRADHGGLIQSRGTHAERRAIPARREALFLGVDGDRAGRLCQ